LPFASPPTSEKARLSAQELGGEPTSNFDADEAGRGASLHYQSLLANAIGLEKLIAAKVGKTNNKR
jgi:hypothetical protein